MDELTTDREDQLSISPLSAIDGPIDKRAVSAVVAFGQASSRRGFLAKCGKVILGVLGVSMVSALPLDRLVADVDAYTCGSYQLLGLCGRICTCCNGGGGLNVCPNGTNWFSYWSSCIHLPYPPYAYQRYYYWDCCGGSANCNSCLWCNSNCPQPAWCNGVPNSYRCTAVVAGGSC